MVEYSGRVVQMSQGSCECNIVLNERMIFYSDGHASSLEHHRIAVTPAQKCTQATAGAGVPSSSGEVSLEHASWLQHSCTCLGMSPMIHDLAVVEDFLQNQPAAVGGLSTSRSFIGLTSQNIRSSRHQCSRMFLTVAFV